MALNRGPCKYCGIDLDTEIGHVSFFDERGLMGCAPSLLLIPKWVAWTKLDMHPIIPPKPGAIFGFIVSEQEITDGTLWINGEKVGTAGLLDFELSYGPSAEELAAIVLSRGYIPVASPREDS